MKNVNWIMAKRMMRRRLSKTVFVTIGIFLAMSLIVTVGTVIISFLRYKETYHVALHDLTFRGIGKYSGIIHSGTIGHIAVILCILVIFFVVVGIGALVYNAFAISVRARANHYRILSGAGASKNQMRTGVLYEAAFMGLCGILPGIPIGLVTGWMLVSAGQSFVKNLFGAEVSGEWVFMVSPLFLILAAVVLFLLILIFAVLPMASMDKLLQLHVEENHRPKKQTPKTSLVLDCSHRSFSKIMAGKYYRHSFRMYMSSILSMIFIVLLVISLSGVFDRLSGSVEVFGLEAEGTLVFRQMVTASHVLFLGFASILFMILAVNIFNVVAANLVSRRKELSLLRALGLTDKEMQHMILQECLQFGLQSLLLALPMATMAGAIVTYRLLGSVQWIALIKGTGISVLCVFMVMVGVIVYGINKLKSLDI